MRKKLLKGLIGVFVLSLGLAMASCAKEETPTSPLEFELREDSYAVVGLGTYEEGNLVIPSEYNGKPVTVIGESAFEYVADIGTVTIPDSVTTIEKNAFLRCPNLSKVTLGGNVVEIQDGAFNYCVQMVEITGLDSVAYVGNSAFKWCSRLKEVEFSNELISISNNAFEECKKLETVSLGNAIETIGTRAFYHCVVLQGLEIPDGAPTDILSEAFATCEKLAYVRLGKDVIGIGNSAFAQCTMLREVSLGDGIVNIGESAFEECRKIYQITLGTSLTQIGAKAFYKCQLLTEVYDRAGILPSDIIGKKNDAGNIYGDIGRYISYVRYGDEPTRISKDKNGLVYYTDGAKKMLVSAILKESGVLTVPDDVTDIRQYACYNEQLITGVVIGNGCKTIGYGAFRNSAKIEFVKLGKNVTTIDDTAFRYNIYITTLVIGSKLESVGKEAFLQKTEGSYKPYETVYFEGTKAEWEKIQFEDGASEPLLASTVTVAYYSETEPTSVGAYWRYVDGEPTMWN